VTYTPLRTCSHGDRPEFGCDGCITTLRVALRREELAAADLWWVTAEIDHPAPPGTTVTIRMPWPDGWTPRSHPELFDIANEVVGTPLIAQFGPDAEAIYAPLLDLRKIKRCEPAPAPAPPQPSLFD
jgi:hypothetical protein